MVRYVGKRLFYTLLLMLFVSLTVYFIFDLLPSDPARLGCVKGCPDSTVELNRIKLGLDVPVIEQWWRLS